MKHSQTIGILASIALIATCFLPWSFIASQQLTVTGFHAQGTSFGKPGLFNAMLSVVMILFFALPVLWAKRTNMFLAAMNLAWAFRNYLLVSSCMMGECPEKKPGLFILLFLAVLIQFMALLPKIKISNEN